MNAFAKKPATYDDIVALPETMVGELLDEELWVSPRPSNTHSVAAMGLSGQLWGSFGSGRGGPGEWWILFEPELHFGKDVLVPDIVGWRRERMPAVPDGPFFTLTPDWVCEVLSPATARLDRMRKMRKYAQAEIGHAWLLEPRTNTLEVFRRQGDAWLLLSSYVGQEKLQAEPFEAAELDLSLLWPSPPEPAQR